MNKPQKNSRKIVIDGQEFWYTVGRSCTAIWGIENGKTRVDNYKIKESSPSVFERGQWKKTSDGMITPEDLAKYIKKNIMG